MNTKELAKAILAQNRFAERPKSISSDVWEKTKKAMEKRFFKEIMDTPEGLYTNDQIWAQTFQPTKWIEEMLKRFAINETSHIDVAQVLNVDADAIQGALVDFKDEWDEAEEPSDADEVIDKWVDILTQKKD